MSIHPDSSWSIKDARDYLRKEAQNGEFLTCPCCESKVKIYRRKMNSGMARALIALYKAAGTSDFAHLPSLHSCHESAQLRWWGLIEEEDVIRPDGGRAGYWRVTELGRRWILGIEKIPLSGPPVYKKKILGSTSGELVTIQQRLGKKFDLQELLYG